MVDRQIRSALEGLDDMLWRGQVRIANPEADDVDAGLCDLPFQTVEFGKKIGGQQTQP